jgi:hypothetical protein
VIDLTRVDLDCYESELILSVTKILYKIDLSNHDEVRLRGFCKYCGVEVRGKDTFCSQLCRYQHYE